MSLTLVFELVWITEPNDIESRFQKRIELSSKEKELRPLDAFRSESLSLEHLVMLMIQDNDVSALDIESGEVLHCVLSIIDIIVDHKRCASCLVAVSTSNLSYRAKLAKDVVELLRRELEW